MVFDSSSSFEGKWAVVVLDIQGDFTEWRKGIFGCKWVR